MADQRFHSMKLNIDGIACVRGDKLLFQNLSLDVSNGEIVEVKGPNGIGKSSLLRLVAGLATPHAGQINLTSSDGLELDIMDHVHFLSHQNALKEPLSVFENLTFWHRFSEEPGLLPEDALAKIALPHLADLPVGVLSAGQKRRVAFARLLVDRRPIWLLDEPTAALDSEADAKVGLLITDHVRKGGLVLAATHLPLKINKDSALINTLQLSAVQEADA